MSVPRDGILLEHLDDVLVITINRPDRRNAIDLATAEALADALDELEGNRRVRTAVITGVGGSFSAGMDLKAFAETGESPVTASRGELGIVRRPPSKPIVAAVDGHVLGGGFEIALACDLIVAGSAASFAFPEVKRGVVAGGGGAIRLAQRLPHSFALELLLLGEPVSADRLFHLGLVNRVVPSDRVLEVGIELARAVARNAPLAVAASKRIVAETHSLRFDEACRLQDAILPAVIGSWDAQEGARAFGERRAPLWRGQ